MLNKIIITVLFFILSSQAQAQDQQSAIDSFNLVISKYSNFFKSPQKTVYRQIYSESPSGVVVSVYEYYDGANISYDIKKTESIISPFSAILEIDVTPRSNKACGNVSGYDTKYGWDTEKEALEKSESSKCYEPQFSKLLDAYDLPNTERIRFNFAYQNNTWVFKTVDKVQLNYNSELINLQGPELPISGALGLYPNPVQAVTSREAIEFNSKWLILIK